MKVLNNISVFKLSIFVLITISYRNIYLFLIISLYLFFFNKKEFILYLILVIIIFLINIFRFDFIPIGIIDDINSKYYVIDKLIYKCQLPINGSFKLGDIVISYGNKITNSSLNSKGILFDVNSINKIYSLTFKNKLYEYIQSLDTSTYYLKEFYNISNYDDPNIFYISSYSLIYVLRDLKNKSVKVCIFSIILYTFIFNFNIKFILIILEIIFDRCNDKADRLGLIVLCCLFLNYSFINNFSFIFYFLIYLYSLFTINISFSLYFALIQSFLFGSFNIINLFFYKYIYIIDIVLLLISIIFLIPCNCIYIFEDILSIYYRIQAIIDVNIRGKLSLFGCIIFICIIYIFIIHKKKYYSIFILCIVLLSPLNNPFFSINYIDVGQGDSILIHNYLNRGNILIDTGSSFNYFKLRKYLLNQGIYTIDYLIITHNDLDHNGNIDNLKSDFIIKNIIEEPIDFSLDNIKLKNYYLGKYDNDNDNSLVYSLCVNNMEFLFTGDISSKAERILIKNYGLLDIDVLKVSHHGSNSASSDYFISNILPRYAIISTSGMYNHPSKEVIDTLNKYDCKVLNTKESGTISFYFSYLFDFIYTSNHNVIILNNDIYN